MHFSLFFLITNVSNCLVQLFSNPCLHAFFIIFFFINYKCIHSYLTYLSILPFICVAQSDTRTGVHRLLFSYIGYISYCCINDRILVWYSMHLLNVYRVHLTYLWGSIWSCLLSSPCINMAATVFNNNALCSVLLGFSLAASVSEGVYFLN